MQEDTEKMLAARLFLSREEGFTHAPFDREIAFYDSICRGDLEAVRLLSTPLCSEGYGILSRDPLRNLKYHFTVSAAMIARFCIKSGMTPEESYRLSDSFILRADESGTSEQVHALHAEMIACYTRKMRSIRNRNVFSRQIAKAIDYISDNLHSRLLLTDAAAVLGLSPAYFSRLFKAETGMTFSDYVNRTKIESAVRLLLYSDYTDPEISALLCFSSQSYFIKIFKKYMGMTPKAYKAEYRIPQF